MNPAAPMVVTVGPQTQDGMPAATQASTALPPSASTSAPTCAVIGWPAAIAPPPAAGSGVTAPESRSASAARVPQELRDLPRVVVPARPAFVVGAERRGRRGAVGRRAVAGVVAAPRLAAGGRRRRRRPARVARAAGVAGLGRREPGGDDGDPHLAGEA